jgi:uncharacterized protein (DUF2147 family)
MRHLALAATLALAASPALAADPVEGDWLTQSGNARVHVGRCAAKQDLMCGTIIWLRDPAMHDAANPDATLKTRPLLGALLIWDFKAVGAGAWTGGKIYEPATGKTYDSKISINPDGTLKVEGCILVLCKAQTWKRS